jgi:MMP 1-O-methyltransferase
MAIKKLVSLPLKGFMDEEEAIRLYELALEASRFGPCLEIGSYCGRSAAYLGMGCRENGGILFSIDHHRGSEEQQPGQPYFDDELVDPETGAIDTFRFLRKTIADLFLEETVVPIVARSEIAAKAWKTPISLLFIDGGHTWEAAYTDYQSWIFHLMPGGFLVIHDIFPDAGQGGQAPRCLYEMALSSGLFVELPMVKTLGVLKRETGSAITADAHKRWKTNNP